MGALGDFFQGAYAYSEQERLRQVEEDNKFKLYEKQQRLVNSLADEDRKTQVVEWEPRPDEGIVVGLNANGEVVTTRPMDKMTQQAAAAGLTKTNNEAAMTGLELSLLGQFGARSKEADIAASRASAGTSAAYGEAAREQARGYRLDNDRIEKGLPPLRGSGSSVVKPPTTSELMKFNDTYESKLEEIRDLMLDPQDKLRAQQTIGYIRDQFANDPVKGVAEFTALVEMLRQEEERRQAAKEAK